MYAPPGGRWFYTVPETGVYFESTGSHDTLLRQVRTHYLLNKLTVPENLSSLVEDHVCRNIGGTFCTGGVASNRLSHFDLVGTLHDLRGASFVERKLAEARAQVCQTCPANKLQHRCTSCSGIESDIRARTGGRKLERYDQYLGACQHMKLHLAAAVHFSLDSLPKAEAPKGCWRNEG